MYTYFSITPSKNYWYKAMWTVVEILTLLSELERQSYVEWKFHNLYLWKSIDNLFTPLHTKVNELFFNYIQIYIILNVKYLGSSKINLLYTNSTMIKN